LPYKLFTLRAMRPGWHNAISSVCIRLAIFVSLVFLLNGAPAASLQTFAVVFGQLTNEIALIESDFDNSPAQKQKLAALIRARGAILDPELRDEQTLATLVTLLGHNSDYTTTLDESASNARGVVLSEYNSVATRVADLPPSGRTATAKARFANLTSDANALATAQHAAAISVLLAPFGRRLLSIGRVVERAETMPRPNIGLHSVRASVNGRRFASAGDGAHSPNVFDVTAPDPLYRQMSCRAVDREQMITFSLPVVTERVRYEVSQGLASLTYTENIFAANPIALTATGGTFFVQSDRNEIYGVFSAAGPGLDVKEGRFRIQLPRELRGN